ncbi:hypothetical protein RN001_006808 [Aquatica leii]|uniref:Regulatory protein zeste n=1 Tax=Aquatica leii TaxID=1421715 RepID=A0AAN7Q259_9COLE|nr:hypothetical protein RN001_006808 [Aquatica leii]
MQNRGNCLTNKYPLNALLRGSPDVAGTTASISEATSSGESIPPDFEKRPTDAESEKQYNEDGSPGATTSATASPNPNQDADGEPPSVHQSQPQREKGTNFSDNEISLLIDVVSKFIVIVENKKTDGSTVKDKNDCWQRIADEFNASALGASRSVGQLKTCYDNLKKRQESKMQMISEGMSPSKAKHFYKSTLLATTSGDKICETLANAQVNPMERSIYHLYEQWSSLKVVQIPETNPTASDLSDSDSAHANISGNYNSEAIRDTYMILQEEFLDSDSDILEYTKIDENRFTKKNNNKKPRFFWSEADIPFTPFTLHIG